MDAREKTYKPALHRRQGVSALLVFYLAVIGGMLGSAATIL